MNDQIDSYKKQEDVFYEAIESIVNPPKSILLPRWKVFNEMTGGLRAHEFSIICGGTGVGKTTWLANLSAQLIAQNVMHFVMSVETGRVDYMRRIISSLAGTDLNTGEKYSVDYVQNAIKNILPEASKPFTKFSIHENRISCEKLIAELKYMHANYGVKVAVIDNLNFFLEVTKSSESIVEMDRVVHDIIMLCKEIPIHIIMVMHPKKTEHGQVLSEFDIKGSSTAVQEAQNVFLLNRPTKEQCEAMPGIIQTDRLLKIAKMRRRGKFVGHSIVYQSNGVDYKEKEKWQ